MFTEFNFSCQILLNIVGLQGFRYGKIQELNIHEKRMVQSERLVSRQSERETCALP